MDYGSSCDLDKYRLPDVRYVLCKHKS
ncbi:hypothetical protein IL54_1864 [Sphingobium sp. ba1]|nr:hypothetical protein IL54_1864 [Sphingobium sp. ba1]